MSTESNIRTAAWVGKGEIQGKSIDPSLSPLVRLEEKRRRQAIENLLAACAADIDHAHQVAFLSLRLFDELGAEHLLGERERLWLEEASLLHDIGAVNGEQGHHKATLRMILTTPLLRFPVNDRLIIGSIARYHRRALPSLEHDHFRALRVPDRQTVCLLASLLRIAEALDGSHACLIQELTCTVKPQKVVVHYCARDLGPSTSQAASDRADLFEQVYNRKIVFHRGKE